MNDRVNIVISFYAAVIFILMIISSESRSEARQRNTMRLRQPLQNTCASRTQSGRITVINDK
ncbi:hypothetical protein Avbf_16379 [Armadillidium vulgare]|nr:hypothetical protein Avbf_16379 [Armadillidium vulgare]